MLGRALQPSRGAGRLSTSMAMRSATAPISWPSSRLASATTVAKANSLRYSSGIREPEPPGGPGA